MPRVYEKHGLEQFELYPNLIRGDVVLTYPNITIDKYIRFEEDEVELYHTPGHSDDSISIIDCFDKVLFAGDNIEEPYPFVEKIMFLNTLNVRKIFNS